MSTESPDQRADEPRDKEQDLLDIAETDLDSAKYAKAILREKYGYDEEELP